ncbi:MULTISPECIES: formyltransferase family protein [Pseudomonas]|nr:formyltransferase family protein [Pseudomonas tolaasii]MBY8943423.1 hypothetical protein [Pseudomonas tolaasii]
MELRHGVALSDSREACYGMEWNTYDTSVEPRVMMMVSQMGHCLNDLLYRNSVDHLPMELVLIVSNLEKFRRRAEHERLDFHYLPVTSEKKQAGSQLLEMVREQKIDTVILARYTQILSGDVSRLWAGQIIDIHHSILLSVKVEGSYHQTHKLRGEAHRSHCPLCDGGPR